MSIILSNYPGPDLSDLSHCCSEKQVWYTAVNHSLTFSKPNLSKKKIITSNKAFIRISTILNGLKAIKIKTRYFNKIIYLKQIIKKFYTVNSWPYICKIIIQTIYNIEISTVYQQIVFNFNIDSYCSY